MPESRTLGLIVALPAEGRAVVGKRGWERQDRFWTHHSPFFLGEDTLLCVQAGIGRENARSAARWLLRQGVSALGVTGVSGGLQPGLTPGDLVVAEGVFQLGNQTEEAWLPVPADFTRLLFEGLANGGVPVYRGPIATRETPVLRREEKERLFSQVGALAVDMESASVANVAAEASLPFFTLRAICDPQQRTISREIFDVLDQAGNPQTLALLGTVFRRPRLAGDLIRMGKDFSAALKALRYGWRLVRQDDFSARLFEGGPSKINVQEADTFSSVRIS